MMSEEQEAGIQIHGILLKESNFTRSPVIPEDIKLGISFQISNSFENNKTHLITEMTCKIDGKKSLAASVTYVGVFSAGPDAGIALEKYAKYNAPATLLPYIREEIQSRMLKAQLPQFGVLPPMNVQAIVDGTNKPKGKKKTTMPQQ